MNKKDLIKEVASRSGATETSVSAVIDSFWDVVTETASSAGSAKAWGMLTIERVATAERKGFNPQTSQPITIPAGERLKVKPMTRLKRAVLES
ncbi:integration host factor [candidate division WWE3 bacterium]|jgi:DNA-binding protein HU-beta|nr:integration host factor [candidate division WWE3 bacterium]